MIDYKAKWVYNITIKEEVMHKLNIQSLLRVLSIIIFIIGLCVGYDLGDKMVAINQVISYQFDLSLAIIVWIITISLSLLFWSIAKIIDLLERR